MLLNWRKRKKYIDSIFPKLYITFYFISLSYLVYWLALLGQN